MKEKGYGYFGDSLKLDLENTHHNTKDGIHTANMGGCYMAVVYGFAGLRMDEKNISFDPFVPEVWHAKKVCQAFFLIYIFFPYFSRKVAQAASSVL